MENFALVAPDDGINVVGNDLFELAAVVDVFNPVGELGVPYEGMASNLLVVLGCKVDEAVGVGPVELTAVGSLRQIENWDGDDWDIRWI